LIDEGHLWALSRGRIGYDSDLSGERTDAWTCRGEWTCLSDGASRWGWDRTHRGRSLSFSLIDHVKSFSSDGCYNMGPLVLLIGIGVVSG
jgi:hypothetical protein